MDRRRGGHGAVWEGKGAQAAVRVIWERASNGGELEFAVLPGKSRRGGGRRPPRARGLGMNGGSWDRDGGSPPNRCSDRRETGSDLRSASVLQGAPLEIDSVVLNENLLQRVSPSVSPSQRPDRVTLRDVPRVRMARRSILVVEDEEDIRELVSYTLLKEGYQVASVASGEEALALAQAQPPDLILLDLMLPGISGLAVCQQLRSRPATAGIAIVMLTAKGEEADIVAGLNAGATDYITKPFSRNVLLARIRAALRHAPPRPDDGPPEDDEPIQVHNLLIDRRRHAVFVDGTPVELSATEFRLLLVLARKPGWVFTREDILDAIHGDSYAVTPRAVDVQIVGLRRKLGKAGEYVETVRGVGYRLKE